MTEHVRQRHVLTKNRVLHAWSVSFPDPVTPDGVRGDRARNMVAEVATGSESVRNDFDRVSIFQRPIFNATWDSSTRRWVDLVGQGEEGFTLSPTEENREVVYRCTPFWYRVEYTEEDGLVYVSVTDRPMVGYKLAPMFKNGSTYEYRPCFEMSLGADNKPHSRAGFRPMTNNPAALMSTVRSYDSAARTEKMADWFCDYILMLVEFATRNLQGILKGANSTYAGLWMVYEETETPDGFYTEEPEALEIGMEFLMKCDGDDGESEVRTVKLLSIDDTETEFGYCATLDVGDVSELFERYYSIMIIHLPLDTGTAMMHITGASSGVYQIGERFSCVWRGKENPCGNVSSLICDVLFNYVDNLQVEIYELASPQELNGKLNEHYVKLETRDSYFGPHESEGHVKAFTYVGEEHRMVPGKMRRQSTDLKCIAFTKMVPSHRAGGIRFLCVGGGYETREETNAVCFELFGEEAYSRIGARMILEEASG